MIQHIGKVAEYFVLAELIRKDVEAYSAISFRQEHYDITVVRPDKTISRVQVKATELHNKSTNNPIGNLVKDYDHLILVIFDGAEPAYFILTKQEAEAEFVPNKPGTIYASRQVRGRFEVKDAIRKHKDRWDKIIGSPPT
jgi:hypothetical protein